MTSRLAKRPTLTFRPFAMLPEEELRAEEEYWHYIRDRAAVGSLISETAERHRQRCIDTLRDRIESLRRGDHIIGEGE